MYLRDWVHAATGTLICVISRITDGSGMSISPLASYYIRQLLSQKRKQLKFVVAPKAGLEAHSLADINAVIDSLYPDIEEAWMVAQKLENLLSMHRVLKQDQDTHGENLALIEKEIYWLLGFKYIEQDLKVYSDH